MKRSASSLKRGFEIEATWDTLFLNSSQPTHVSVFSPVDSLNKAMLKADGVNVPAAKYSFVWSGQNAMDETIPAHQWFSGEVKICRPAERVLIDLSSHPSPSWKESCGASSLRRSRAGERRTPQSHLRTRSISYPPVKVN